MTKLAVVASVFALLGVPAFFYGLSRSNFWFAGPGFILGGIGAGIVLGDWAICGFPLPF